MKNDKHKLLATSKELRGILKTIENLLDGYDGIEGNKNYTKYCSEKAKQANEDDDSLNQLYDDTYNVDMSKRRGINIATLLYIVEKHFKLLDDIDTASDMFKPKFCKITSAVNQLQQLRWLVATFEGDNKGDDGVMVVNGNCFKKEQRTILNF
jgi:hypothetical protein